MGGKCVQVDLSKGWETFEAMCMDRLQLPGSHKVRVGAHLSMGKVEGE